MIATLKEVVEVESASMVIQLPTEFLHHRVEITVRPLEEKESDLDPDAWPLGYFEHYAGCLPDFPDIESEGDYEVREPLT